MYTCANGVPILHSYAQARTCGILWVWFDEGINYELAKQLKHAAFPKATFTVTEPNAKYPKQRGQSNAPTLSELIEACAKTYGRVALVIDPDMESVAASESEGTKGSTPEEAVAKLWLALNKI